MSEPKTVLVVDDDKNIRCFLAMALEDEGYKVKLAGNGCEALEVVERDMPNLILLDLTMPVMDGCAFADRFHAAYGSRIPVVVMTADINAQKRADQIGAVDCMRKPFDLDKLLHTVSHHLGIDSNGDKGN